MNTRDIFFDTNILLLYIVGLTNKDIIPKHKKLSTFTAADFDLICTIISTRFERILVTPHVLAETSNLLSYHNDPEKTQIMLAFALMITEQTFFELYKPSNEYIDTYVQDYLFHRLGLTDCGILESIPHGASLLTEDLDLYSSAMGKEINALNLNHFRT